MNHKEVVHRNGKQLAYVRTNDWKDDIILFFHGFCGSKEYFPDVDDDPCIVSFDRPGIGESDVEQYYSMEGFLTNVYEVLKDHHVSPVRVATNKLVKGQWKFIVLLSLRFKWFSRFYFKKMASGINKGYEKQLASNMKKLLPVERQFMEENHDMIKTAVLNAVANDGAGVCYDACALCQKRDDLTISRDIPVYVWHGSEDTTTPLSFIEFFRSRYSVKAEHIIDHVGHMLYLPYWREILEEAIR